METEDFKKLKSLANSPELFEMKRQHLLNDFISSAINKEEQEKLRTIQKLIDSKRDQPDFLVNLVKDLFQRVVLNSHDLKDFMSTNLFKQPSTLISFPRKKE